MNGTSSGTVSETVSPVRVTLPAGQLDHTGKITVTNTGGQAIAVHAAPAILSSTCKVGSAPTWVTVSPASKVLKPGQTEHATLTVHAPAGTTGTIHTAALFTATGQAHGNANAKMAGTVASQVIIHTGSTTPVACGHHEAAAGGQTGITAPLVALAIAALLLIAAILGFIALRRRTHRGAHRGA